MREIKFWDSKLSVSQELLDTIKHIMESGTLSMRAGGPYVLKLEEELKRMSGRKYAVAVSSATAGLMLLFSHESFKDREIILPAFTFAATMTAAQWNRMRLIFCDVDKDTWTIDANDAAAKISHKTAAIVPVNMFGNPPDYKVLSAVAEDNEIPLLVDDAQSMGSIYNTSPAGSFGQAAVFSFSPSKVLTGGEGGAIVTDDPGIYEHCLRGRHYGDDGSYNPRFPGMNAKLTEIQAAIILDQLPGLKKKVQCAKSRAENYKANLSNKVIFQRENGESAWKEFTILVPGKNRPHVSAALTNAGIEHRTYWHRPLHMTTAYFSYAGRKGHSSLKVTEQLASRVISLPMHDMISLSDIRYISGVVNNIVCNNR